MRLSTLVETSKGGLVPVAGTGPDPQIEAVITTDMVDPRRYLTGGELVLTGLAWWRPGRPARSAAFVASLMAGGAVALACGEAEIGPVPEDLLAACAEAGLPLLRVPVEHAFAAVIERATRHLAGREDLAAVLARHRALVTAATARDGGAGLAALVDLVAADLGVRCWVLSAAGRPIAGRDVDPREAGALARQFVRAPRLPHVVRGTTLFAAGPPGPRGGAWVLAVRSDHTTWRENRRGAVEELASLAALEREIARNRSDVERQLVAVLRRADRADLAAAAQRCGVDLTVPSVVVAGTGALAGVVVAEALSPVDDPGWGPWALGELDGEAVAVVSAAVPGPLVAALRSTLDALDPGLGPSPVRLGVSDAVTGADGLLGALAEARAAAEAAPIDRPHTVAGPELLSSFPFLLAAVPAELRAAYRSRVLGPLIDHDRAHRTDLVTTLRTYLECSGSWARCAERMHVHVNTLRYRIERIEALTGRDLRRLTDQTDLLLALNLP